MKRRIPEFIVLAVLGVAAWIMLPHWRYAIIGGLVVRVVGELGWAGIKRLRRNGGAR